MSLPIFKANLLNSDKEVQDAYAYDEVHKRYLILTNEVHWLVENRIDYKTLKISFDNGEKWYDIDYLYSLIKYDEAMEEFSNNTECGRWIERDAFDEL